MTQINIKAKNRAEAKRKFLKRYPKQKIYDITRTFYSWKETKPKDRVYRVTGISK